MKSFSQLKKNNKLDFSNLKKIKVAILGDSATQFLNEALRGTGYDSGFDLEIFEADFNQIERQIFDTNSELYDFQPEIVIVFHSSHKLLSEYNKLEQTENSSLASTRIDLIKNLFQAVDSSLNAKMIYYNYSEIDDSIFGNFANKVESSFLFQIRKLNYELMLFAMENPNFHICDMQSIQNKIGKSTLFQPSIYVNSEMVLSIDALPEIAFKTLKIVEAFQANIKKCLILDLDNTLWGGVIGDDGVENIEIGNLGIGKAFTEFQYWIKKLKNRGIILAVCSKNTESIAKEPFEKHPDMILKLEDIAVFVANWENKADNIRQIQSILNIGFDSMVFLDDNPFERNIVRENIPGITIPELPEDPAEYLEYLYPLNIFETISFSSADSERTKQYQDEAQRVVVQKQYTNEDDFLKSLNMISVVEPFNDFNNPRVAQLSQRSNQFNLRTVRYTESDIKKLGDDDNYFTFTFTLNDKFGDNGMICVIILKKENQDTLFIDTWFMSCRVLKRGMENFVLNGIVNKAKEKGYHYLKGEYIATPKNEMVKNHYEKLDFTSDKNYWLLATDKYEQKKTFIEFKK
jgi:FkbH-like protein